MVYTAKFNVTDQDNKLINVDKILMELYVVEWEFPYM